MKKKRSALMGSVLGFLAVLIGEAYCLLNFRGDYIVIVGVGIVLLIMAYLAMDAWFEYWENSEELPFEEESEDPDGWAYGHMEPMLSMEKGNSIEKGTSIKNAQEEKKKHKAEVVQQGMYVVQRRGFENLEKELRSLREELSELLRAEIKYERENTKYIISHNKKELEQLSEKIQGLQDELEAFWGPSEKQ